MPTSDRRDVLGWIGAGCFFAIIVADMTYGAIKGREGLVTWIQILLGALALFALFNSSITEITLSLTGVTIRRKIEEAAETAVNLGAGAVVDKVKAGIELSKVGKSVAKDLRQIARTIAEAIPTRAISRLAVKRVLWVDDEPQNNEYATNALRAQGIEVVQCISTREALEEVKKGKFDVIITDQLRVEDGIRKYTAGNELLRALRDSGVKVPVILSTAFPDHEKARSAGFYDTTNTQHGVFELVMQAIQKA
jgi:CheY-like chemotaxis protein